MAIEHLHLENPVPIDSSDLPYLLADRQLAEHADRIQLLEPGLYDMTPKDTNYPAGPIVYNVEVLESGAAVCGQHIAQDIFQPDGGRLRQNVIYIPGTFTQLAIVDMRKGNVYRHSGLPHIFDILRWRPDDDILAYMPGIALATSHPEAREDLWPHLEWLQMPYQPDR